MTSDFGFFGYETFDYSFEEFGDFIDILTEL